MTTRSPTTVLVAPTAFKGTLGPAEVAEAMASGVARVWPEAEIIRRPVSDGGNGLLESYLAYDAGRLQQVEVTGPLGERVQARFVRSESVAVIESAEGCGLHLVPPAERDPLRASTRGVGELLLAARDQGASRVLLGLGGSATVDGGSGMAKALGWRLSTVAGAPLQEGGGPLEQLRRIDEPANRYRLRVTVLCDVQNPLIGPNGAATVFGPQKGAVPEQVRRLEAALTRLAEVVRTDLGIDLVDLPGAGAAGGLGAGARAFLSADLVAGAEWILEQWDLRHVLAGADLLVTGEGRFDTQSSMGKITGRLLDLAVSMGVSALLVCGRVDGPVASVARAADGGGRVVSYADLVRLTEDACRELAVGDRL
ncbi:MAG: glycerate kinase [Gemmatimonadales bacterium]|jgi:glycerate kinase